MKIKLDENLPGSLAQALAARGHDTDTAIDEGLQGKADPDVWLASQNDRRFFITSDFDFSDIRKFQPGTHCGLLFLRLKRRQRRLIIRRVTELFDVEDVSTWEGAFIVATESKVRVRR